MNRSGVTEMSRTLAEYPSEGADKALSTLSQKSATVAVFSPLSATVAVFCDSRTFLRQCGQNLRRQMKVHSNLQMLSQETGNANLVNEVETGIK